METAWKTAAVEPVMVVIRSGQEPSEMVIRALLCRCGTSTGQQASSPLRWQGSVCPPPHLGPAKSRKCHSSGHSLITGGVIQGKMATFPPLNIRALGSFADPIFTCSRIRFTVSPFCGRQKPRFLSGHLFARAKTQVEGNIQSRTGHLPSQ